MRCHHRALQGKLMETTKRFARSLADAFPDERFAAIEKPLPRRRLLGWIVVLTLGTIALYILKEML